jgi:DNA end-binding protein Ku
VRNADEYFDDISDVKIAPDMLKLAEHILQKKEAEFEPANFEDHYEQALIEFIRKKQAKMPVLKGKTAQPVATNVVNLMDALRRSVQGGKDLPKPKKGKKRIAGQKEMLFPISGKAAPRETKAERPARAAPKRSAR